MAREKLELDITTDGAEKTAKQLDDIADGLDDVRSKGKRVADELSQTADKIKTNWQRAEAATESLSNALGPEFVSALERGGGSVDRIIADLKRLGLTYEDIEADVDELAASIRKFDSINLDGSRRQVQDVGDQAQRTKGDIDQLSDSGRGANSALANMIGNSTQDVAELGGIAGSAGVALGQMGEYAADASLGGEALGASLRSMAMVAGPIAALAIGTQLLGKWIGDASKKQEELRKATDEATDALVRAQDAGEGYGEALEDISRGRVDKAFADIADELDTLLPALDAIGVSYDDVVRAFRDGDGPLVTGLERFRQMDDQLDEAKLVFMARGFGSAFELLAEGTNRSAESLEAEYNALKIVNDALGDNQNLSAESIKIAQNLTEWRGRDTEAGEEQTRMVDRGRDSISRSTRAIDDNAEAVETMADRMRRATDELDTLTDRFDRLRGVINDRQAYRDLQAEFDNVAAAAAEAWEAAATGAEDSEAKARAHADTVDALKLKVIEYGDEIAGLPEEQVTDILTLIDQGKFAEAEAAIASLERTRTVKIFIDAVVMPKLKNIFDFLGASTSATSTTLSGAPSGVKAMSATPMSASASATIVGGGGVNLTVNVGGTVVSQHQLDRAIIDSLYRAKRAGASLPWSG